MKIHDYFTFWTNSRSNSVQKLYDRLTPISETIKVRQTRHQGHYKQSTFYYGFLQFTDQQIPMLTDQQKNIIMSVQTLRGL